MKLSVIIPLYNAEKYIGKAIESVLSQKGIEVECIVVDDDSTDSSAEIVKNYPIKYLHKQNGGASSARNFGLKYASGEFVMFLDADDFISDDTICRQCVDKIINRELDFCLFTYQYFNDKNSLYASSIKYNPEWENIENTDILLNKMIGNGHFPASPCFRILKRSFIEANNLYFKEGTTSEDVLWFTRVLIATHRFSLINNDAYKYRKGIATSVTGSPSIKKCIDFCDILKFSVTCVSNMTDDSRKYALYSALNYEFMILLANSYRYFSNIELRNKISQFSFLFEYVLFPRAKYLYYFHAVFGLRLTSKLLNFYLLKKSKSNA